MKAIVDQKNGSPDPLRYQELPQPTWGDRQVLIRVHATSLNSFDGRRLDADPWLVRWYAGLWKSQKNGKISHTLTVTTDGRYPLDQAARAFRYLRPGYAQGKVAVNPLASGGKD